MEEIVLKVEGMSCGGCENRIKNALMNINGVKKVEASYKKEQVKVKVNESNLQNEIKEVITNLGYEVK